MPNGGADHDHLPVIGAERPLVQVTRPSVLMVARGLMRQIAVGLAASGAVSL